MRSEIPRFSRIDQKHGLKKIFMRHDGAPENRLALEVHDKFSYLRLPFASRILGGAKKAILVNHAISKP